MLRLHTWVVGFAAAGALVVGCGDSETTSDDGGAVVGLPPGPGPEKAADGGEVVMGASKLYLGDSSNDAWIDLGFNIDKIVSTNDFSNHCQPASDGLAPGEVFVDGNNGIDNNFGAKLLPILVPLVENIGDAANSGISDGSFTILLQMNGLGEDSDYNPLPTSLFAGKDGAMPGNTSGAVWKTVPEFAGVDFTTSYLVDNTWVSGPDTTTVSLSLNVGGFSIELPITNAIIAMDLDSGHSSASNGTIAGTIPVEDLITELGKIAGSFGGDSLCPGNPTFETLANNIRQNADMPADGVQSADKTCDAISIGLGFDAVTMTIDGPGSPGEAVCNPCDGMECNEGGAGGMGGAGGAGGGS